jgi:glucose/arabinose dehydrogenase
VARPLTLAAAVALCALAACGGSAPSDAPARTAAPTAATGPKAAAAARLHLVSIGRFDHPLYVTAPRGDRRRVFVVEQTGRIRVVRGGKTLARPFLDVSGSIVSGGEQGLLGMAFAPDYSKSGLFYVDYTDTHGDTRVVEFKRQTADRADPGSARDVLHVAQPQPNHNGGEVTFGPDGLLYVGLGDGGAEGDPHGARGNGQNLGTLLGKLLRIDPRRSGGRAYGVPASNPFVHRGGARPEIYAYGLRNPWRFSFDRRTGDLAIGDVGQDHWEELDFARRGRARGVNYGWRPFEGDHRLYNEPAAGAVKPVLEYSHAGGNCSVTGGYVVRDRGVPSLYGRYVYGDYCKGKLYSVKLGAGRATGRRAPALPTVSSLSSFGEDARGRVYVTSGDGPVYRFAQ